MSILHECEKLAAAAEIKKADEEDEQPLGTAGKSVDSGSIAPTTDPTASEVGDDGDEMNVLIGNFGRYQAIAFLFLALVSFMNGGIAMAPSWTMYSEQARCRLNSFDDSDTRFPSRISAATRKTELAADMCYVCVDFSVDDSKCAERLQCPNGTVFMSKELIFHSHAVEHEMDCGHAWRKRLIWTLMGVGTLVANVYNGPIGDRLGRRFVFILVCWLGLVTCIGINFVNSFNTFALASFLLTATCFAQYTPAITVFSECSGSAPRVWLIFLSSVLWTCGILWAGLVAYLTRDRFYVQALIVSPILLLAPLCWLFPESIRWLAVNGYRARAVQQLLYAARLNGLQVDHARVDQYLDSMMAECMKDANSKSTHTLLDMFKHWRTAKRASINFFCWLAFATVPKFAVSMCYYGLSQAATELPSDPFLTYTLSALVELPSYVIGPWITERFGRRAALMSTFWLAGTGCILSAFVTNSVLIIMCALVGKLAISASFMAMFVYSAELFPTVIRMYGTSSSNVFARLGALGAPLVAVLGDFGWLWLPVMFYGSVALVAGGLAWFLPETKQKKLPDTIEDAIKFGVDEEKKLITNVESCSAFGI